MGSSDGTDVVATEASDLTFPEADVDRELNPGDNKNFQVDPISSKVATSLEMKEEEIKAVEREKEARRGREEAVQTLKTTIFVSAVVVAVAGAVFAIAKKLRETG